MGPWDPAPSGPEAPGPEPKRRGSRVWIRVLVIAALVCLAAVATAHLSNFRFEVGEVTFEDRVVDLDLIEPIAPPVVPPVAPPAPRTTIGPDGEVLRQPVWVVQPRPNFPALALSRGTLSGDVRLRCETLATGEFGACEVLGESPPGAGFAEAALAATRQARVKPYAIDGFETDSAVAFTVRFRTAPEP